MFSLSSVVESVFGTLSAEETMPQSRAHDEDRSATTTDTIDNPEDAQANKDQLADKQEEADGAEDEEEEEVPDVSLPLVAALARDCRAPVSVRHLADPLSALPRSQQGDEIREGAHLVLPPLRPPHRGGCAPHPRELTQLSARAPHSVRQHQGVQGVQAPL